MYVKEEDNPELLIQELVYNGKLEDSKVERVNIKGFIWSLDRKL